MLIPTMRKGTKYQSRRTIIQPHVIGISTLLIIVIRTLSFYETINTDNDESWLDLATTTDKNKEPVRVEQPRSPTIQESFLRYHEMPASKFKKEAGPMFTSSYSQAKSVVRKSLPWFTPPYHDEPETRNNKFCKETCCATPIAISISHEDRRIINTVDGLDLADVHVQHYLNRQLDFFAPTLTPDLLPCLQPGVIIHLENHATISDYFFRVLRKNITVPYVLITSEADEYSPYNYVDDDLLIKWYGSNADISRLHHIKDKTKAKDKIVPFPLGLSKNHDQNRPLTKYLKLRNYTNPFRGLKGKQRWTDWATSLSQREKDSKAIDTFAEVRDVMFMKYGIISQSHEMRTTVFNNLCNYTNSDVRSKYTPREPVSCHMDKITPHQTYTAASTYLFGFSPPGAGWDCYRTYELLLLGVIPIIVSLKSGSHGLFDGLPVIELPYGTDFTAYSTEDYLRLMRDYVTSAEFLERDFDDGWERLFLQNWRRRVLEDAGRKEEVMTDENGEEYYMAWEYKPLQPRILCSKEENCKS